MYIIAMNYMTLYVHVVVTATIDIIHYGVYDIYICCNSHVTEIECSVVRFVEKLTLVYTPISKDCEHPCCLS